MVGQKLRIIQINDVYILDNMPHIGTVVKEYGTGDFDKMIFLLSGDFLGPSLLSSLDGGRGMIDVLNMVGLTHCSIGNHEADVSTKHLVRRIKESKFEWVNTNMQDLGPKIGVLTPEFSIVEVGSRKVALLGLITDEEGLMRPTAFNGAKVDPVFQKAEEFTSKLYDGRKVDIVVPMTHLDMEDDRKLAQVFGSKFPVIIGGHDHEPYDETINGSRIIKAGLDGHAVAIIDVAWKDETSQDAPDVTVQMLKAADFEKDPAVLSRVEKHHLALKQLEETHLFNVKTCTKKVFSTKNNRLGPSVGSSALATAAKNGLGADCCIIHAGAIRAGQEYTDDEWFSYADLKTEMPHSCEMAVVRLMGSILKDTMLFSRKESFRSPPVSSGGFLHGDNQLIMTKDNLGIKSIDGEPFDPERVYNVALPICLMQGVDNLVPLLNWVKETGKKWSVEAGVPAKEVIVEAYSAMFWYNFASFSEMDKDHDGVLTQDEVKAHLLTKFDGEVADLLLSNVMSVADSNGDDTISLMEMMGAILIAEDMAEDLSLMDEEDLDRTLTGLAADVLGVGSPEAKKMAAELRTKLDTDGDGQISNSEALAMFGDLERKEFSK